MMRTIYIDSEGKCHLEGGDGLTAVETKFFDGKCDAFVEGYRIEHYGEIGEDGKVSQVRTITPWKDHRELERVQREYEKALLAEYAEALREVGVDV